MLTSYWKNYSVSEINDPIYSLLCLSSCLRNHNRFWQICPNSHSRQQAQVKTIFCFDLLLESGTFFTCWLMTMHFLFHRELQENLVRSHSAGNKTLFKAHTGLDFKIAISSVHMTKCFRLCCIYTSIVNVMLRCVGVGNPLSPERTRMLLALRINVLAKGHSGISLETLHAMIQAFNGKPPTWFHLSWSGTSASTLIRDQYLRSWLSLCLCSFLPLLCPREGNSGC